MASEDRHITRIEKTEALFRTNGDHGQSCILTDQNEEWVYYNDDKSLLYYGAAQKTWDGAAWAYVDNDFGQVTLHDDLLVDEYIRRSGGTDDLIRFENDKISIEAGGTVAAVFEDTLINFLLPTQIHDDLLVDEYIKRSGGTDDRIRFENDKISIEAGGAVAAVFEDTLINFLLPTQIGDAGTPSALSILQIQKDQNAGTETRCMNDTAGNAAYAGFKVWANSASGLFAAYDDAYASTEFTDKVVVSTGTTALALMATSGTSEIQFYAGGFASGDKVARFDDSHYLKFFWSTNNVEFQDCPDCTDAEVCTPAGYLLLDCDDGDTRYIQLYSGFPE